MKSQVKQEKNSILFAHTVACSRAVVVEGVDAFITNGAMLGAERLENITFAAVSERQEVTGRKGDVRDVIDRIFSF